LLHLLVYDVSVVYIIEISFQLYILLYKALFFVFLKPTVCYAAQEGDFRSSLWGTSEGMCSHTRCSPMPIALFMIFDFVTCLSFLGIGRGAWNFMKWFPRHQQKDLCNGVSSDWLWILNAYSMTLSNLRFLYPVSCCR
jgi:hypothetical protein